MPLTRLIEQMRAGQFEAARVSWSALGEARLQRPELVQAGAIVHEQLAMYAEAASLWARFAAMHPDQLEPVHARADSLASAGQARQAAEVLTRHCQVHPDDARGWTLLARILTSLERSVPSLSAAQHALEAAPDDPEVVALAAARVVSVDRELAALLMARAEALGPSSAAAWSDLATTRHLLGDLRGSLAAWKTVLRLDPAHHEVHTRLAILHEQLGQREATRAMAEEALRLHPGQLAAERVLLRLDHQEHHLDRARARALSLLGRPLKPKDRSSILLELAIVERRLGLMDSAFDRARQGNALREQLLREEGWDLDAYPRLLDRVLTWEASPQAPPRAADARRAPAFVAGLPRSGTTLTQEILHSHPSIQVLDELDPSLDVLRAHLSSRDLPSTFPTCLESLEPEDWTRLRSDYWSAIDALGLPAHQLLVDKLPLHLVRLDYLTRLFSDSRVLVVLRDPRDSLLSFFFQDFQPNQAMAQSVELARAARMYAAVVQIWLDRRERLPVPWMEVRYEELTADTGARVREVLDFLELPWHPDVLSTQSRAARPISTPSRYDVARPVYRSAVGRWERFRAHLEPVLPILEPAALALGYPPS